MTTFKDIPVKSEFFDPYCGEDFVKVNSQEARMISDTMGENGEVELTLFMEEEVVQTMEEAEADALPKFMKGKTSL